MASRSAKGGGVGSSSADRVISFGPGLARIPERLLLAHARGQVLFLVGAGVSRASGHPDFRGLVESVYKTQDLSIYSFIEKTRNVKNVESVKSALTKATLADGQKAEVLRFLAGDFDVALGMLERRIDGAELLTSKVREAVATELRNGDKKPAAIHRSLMRLSDRGMTSTIITTNFEYLLERAGKGRHGKPTTYSLGGIPRPSLRDDFSGVLHIHGALDADASRTGDLIFSDRDFGEFYLRRRVVPDFIYDAARLFYIVLVGYSANDPPMRYLLNAVAADGRRFSDLKERFTFVPVDKPDPILMEDWKGRGITPIEYDSANDHTALEKTLTRWAAFSANSGRQATVNAAVKRAVAQSRATADDATRDLFDHLIRRSDPAERTRIAGFASKHGADLDWLDAIISISTEKERVTT